MADASTVKDALDGVVRAIGFGIVSDFRELADTMVGMSGDLQESTRLIDQTNQNFTGVTRALNEFDQKLMQSKQTREARKLEARVESRARINADRTEASVRQIAKAIEDIKRQIAFGQANAGKEDTSPIEDAVDTATNVATGVVAGAGLLGAAKVAGKTAIGAVALGGVAAVGAAGAYLMSSIGGGQSAPESSGGAIAPTSPVSGSDGTPTLAADASRMGSGVSLASQAGPLALVAVNQISKTAKQKALAKVAARAPSWLSKFGGRFAATIGLKSVPIFGALIGGYFSFSRFMAGDSWTAIGAEFVSGVAPDIGALAGPAGYVAGVASTLSIQVYLMCRDIYQEENAIDIKNGVVPNFDDLDVAERTQVIKAVGVYVESYINGLLGRTSASDATTGITPSAASGAAPGAAIAAGSTGAALTGAADTGGAAGAGSSPPPAGPGSTGTTSAGITTGAAADISQQRSQSEASGLLPPGYDNIPQDAADQNTYMDSGRSPETPENEGGTSPNDTIASLNTRSDQTSMYTGQDQPVVEILEAGKGYNIVRLADGSVVKRTGDRNWRNNNPGNIEYGDFSKRNGAIGSDGRFAIFPDMATGRAAKESLLFEGKNYRDKTIAQAITRYAPPSDNNPTDIYISRVSQAAGVDPNTPLAALNPDQRSVMMDEMARVEGMRQGKTQVLEPPRPMAEGATITPLASDSPKPGKDVSVGLSPPKMSEDLKDEEKFTSEQSMIDARRKEVSTGSMKEKVKNSIASYTPFMSYLFGTMTDELRSHVNGEVTADKAFKDAMNPLS